MDILAGRFETVKVLGEGGFGKTLLVLDKLQGDRPCALKLLSSVTTDPTKEFELLRSLYHPHIVEVLSAGRLEDRDRTPYLVFEYVDGGEITALKDFWDPFAQTCRALSYLHSREVVHGDLKPSNLIVAKTGRAKLIDFGLSFAQKNDGPKMRDLPAGTFAYMAPEVIQKGERGARSDLYALGLILYQLVNRGRLPFPITTEGILKFHLQTPVDGMDWGLAKHPWKTALEKILRRLLAKDPGDRPGDALEVLTALNREAGASFEVHRGLKNTEDEAVFFQDIQDYMDQVGRVLDLPSVTTPKSFLEEEERRIGKYLNALQGAGARGATEWAGRLNEVKARIAIQRGRYREAAAANGSSEGLEIVRALARIFLEDYDAAEKPLSRIAERGGSALNRARADNYLGLAAYNRGRLDRAADCFERSLTGMRALGEKAGVVSNAMNLAAVRQQQGRISDALKLYQDALAAAEGLKNSYLLAILLSNMANLYLSVGAVDEGEAHLAKSENLAGALGMTLMDGYNLLLAADAAMWRRDFAEADRHLETAAEIFQKIPSPMYLALARVASAENGLRAHSWRDLPDRIARASAAVSKSNLPDAHCRLELVKLQFQISQKKDLDQAERRLAGIEMKASTPQDKFQAEATKAQLKLAQNQAAEAEKSLGGLKELLEKDRKSVPIAYRAGLAEAPRYALYWEAEEALRVSREPVAETSLWKLVEINRRLVSEKNPERLIGMVLDAAIELTGAERGFLIMPEYGKWKRGTWKVKAARHFRERDLPGGKDLLSRTIIDRVLEKRMPLLVHDAQEESDLKQFKSVQALKLRSILATPVLVHREMLGALYLDHADAASLFADKDLALLKALADQAGLALANARLYDDALRREKALEEARARLEETNARLEEELKKKSEWAETVEEELKKAQVAGPVVARSAVMRHIVTQVPAMARLKRPVLLVGEAGVGKGFLAKLLHQEAGAGPFRREPASQLPRQKSSPEGLEALTRLFDDARGGTLYVDEITDLPAPFQRDLAKRLATSQDVFVVLSTRVDPKEAVKKELLLPELQRALTGSEVRIPPLRERKEDVGPLIAHFLRELSTTQNLHRGIKKSAMGILHEYDWPGNVRELRLEVERAALASQTSISPTDLSPNVLGQSGFVPGVPKKEAVDLHEKRAQFERETILRVLEGTGWNKLRAAKKLGLSRAMLYIKLQKYKIPLR
ncbi:MAG TPA: protein kinase [bacterium]|nr:protein kinase [bacterium]